MYQKRRTLEQFFLMVLDILSMFLATMLAFYIRYKTVVGISENWDQQWMIGYMVAAMILLDLWRIFDKRFFRRGYLDELWACIKKQVAFSGCWVLILYMAHRSNELSRGVFAYYIVSGILIMFFFHTIFKWIMIRLFQKSRYCNNMLLLCTLDKAEETVDMILRYHDWNRKVIGVALLDKTDQPVKSVRGIPIVCNGENLMEYITKEEIDELFIVDAKDSHREELDKWLPQVVDMGIVVDVNISAFDCEFPCTKTMNRVGKYATVTLMRNEFSVVQLVMKRTLDILGSLVGMVILAIATIFVAPLIKLESPGPVFFGQTRIGKNGRKFTFYKFRSMYQDAEERKKELMEKNEVKGLMFKMEDDPRITKVGKILRKTSIDELPQFWNVLKGDMSLVGTRPPTVDEFERYEAKYKCRLSMTPGITGLWQVSGRSEIKDFDEVVNLDMQYIDNWTIMKDIQILCKTVWVVLVGRGSK